MFFSCETVNYDVQHGLLRPGRLRRSARPTAADNEGVCKARWKVSGGRKDSRLVGLPWGQDTQGSLYET